MTATLPLRRLARIVNGGTPSADAENWGGDVRWATPIDLAKVDGGFISETDRTLTSIGLRQGSASVPPGSVLVSSRAPIGYAAIAQITIAFNQGCKGLVPLAGVDGRYLRYWLSAQRDDLQAAGSGSTFMELSGDALMRFPVPNRSEAEQRRIADFLDDQVARINHIIAARRTQGELNDELWDEYLREAIAAEDNPVTPLWAAARWQEGPGILAKDFRDDGVPILRISHLRASPPSLAGCQFVGSTLGEGRWGHFRTEMGDLILSGSASTGELAVWVTPQISGAIPYTGLIKIRARDGRLIPEYMRYFFLSKIFAEQINLLKSGIGIQHWGPSHLSQVKLPLPPVGQQRDVVEALDIAERDHASRGSGLTRSIDLFEELKRSLITAAVTGEFDVSSADGSRVLIG